MSNRGAGAIDRGAPAWLRSAAWTCTNLSGKTALVTGAGSGIGKETALAFARAAPTWCSAISTPTASPRPNGEIQALGREVLARRVDVADRAAMAAFAAAVHERVAAVDILMNNAGVGLGGGFLHTELDDWDWIIGINLRGVIHGCHFFIPPMVARGRGGHVVNVASAAGYVATEPLVGLLHDQVRRRRSLRGPARRAGARTASASPPSARA